MQAVIYVHTADTNPVLRNHQIVRCKQLAAQEGYHVILIVSDTGYGTQQKRPGLQHLRTLVEIDAIDTLIVLDYAHISRQPEEIRDFLTFCRSHNVQIRTVNEWRVGTAERAFGA